MILLQFRRLTIYLSEFFSGFLSWRRVKENEKYHALQKKSSAID